MGSQGKLCYRLLSDSIPGYPTLIPLLFCWFNFLDKKAVKNYMKEDSNTYEMKTYLIFFLYSWVQQPFSG